MAEYSERGLCKLSFPNGTARASGDHPLAEDTRRAIESILAGVAPRTLPAMDVKSGTEFQRAVWKRLSAIACGETKSYAEVAAEIGSPKASRAVGTACGANPIPLLIPCHRVVAASGKIGGFSGGTDWKKRLLAAEEPALSLR